MAEHKHFVVIGLGSFGGALAERLERERLPRDRHGPEQGPCRVAERRALRGRHRRRPRARLGRPPADRDQSERGDHQHGRGHHPVAPLDAAREGARREAGDREGCHRGARPDPEVPGRRPRDLPRDRDRPAARGPDDLAERARLPGDRPGVQLRGGRVARPAGPARRWSNSTSGRSTTCGSSA